MSLDEIAGKYPDAKQLPKYKQLIADYMPTFPKFGYFGMFKILSDLAALRKANPADPSLVAVFDKVKQATEMYKKQFSANFDDDQDEFKEFVAQRFLEADTEVRNKTTTIETIKKLLNAASMLEIMTIFGALSEETQKRKKWAKAMAVKLKKAYDETGDTNNYAGGSKTADLGAGIHDPYGGLSTATEGANGFAGQPLDPFTNSTTPNGPSQARPSNPFETEPEHYPHPFSDNSTDEFAVVNRPPQTPAKQPSASYGSSINSHEKSVLDAFLLRPASKIAEPLNSIFRVDIKRVSAQAGATEGVSFMNSTLYINNRYEFEEKGFEIQDELKKATNLLNTDLATSYQQLCRVKQMMLDVLKG